MKAQTQWLLRLYFRATINFMCTFYGNSTQNISLGFHLFIKTITLLCGHHLEGQIWHSESSKQCLFRLYFRGTISSFYCIHISYTHNKVQFINKNNYTVLSASFGRSEMVLNVDFRDIWTKFSKFGSLETRL